MQFFMYKICTYQIYFVILHRETKITTQKHKTNMKTTTAIKNIEKAVEQLNARQFRNVKSTKAYRLIIDALENNKTMIRPAHYSGRGRFATALDYTDDVRRILDAAKIKYNAGNDAPRGGKEGNYIILTHING